MIRSLLRLSLSTGSYIPLAPLIFEVLSSGEIKKKPKPATLKPLDFSVTIRVPKSYLRTRIYQDGLAEQVVELFAEFYVLYSKSIAFPELSIPTIVLVKRFIKKSRNAKFNSALHVLIAKLEANAKFIQEKRQTVDFAPGRRAGVDAFLKETEWETTPLGAYVVSQRKVREEKMRLLEEALKEEREKRQKDKHAKLQEDEDSDVFMSDDGEESGDDGEMDAMSEDDE